MFLDGKDASGLCGWAQVVTGSGQKKPQPHAPLICLCVGITLSHQQPCQLSLSTPLLQDVHSQVVAIEDTGTMDPARSRAKSRATLDELLDTLRLLEEEPEPLPHPRAYHKDKYAWTDEVTGLCTLPHPNLSNCRVREDGSHHTPCFS